MWLIGATTWLSHQFLLHAGYAIKSRNLFRTQGCTWWSSEESLIGASLSEPHTSVTALHMCVSIYLAIYLWTDHLP